MTSVRADVPARAHLAGNPSDGYGGAVLSMTVPTLVATVVATGADRFSIHGPTDTWDSMGSLVDETRRLGHHGGDRLVRAALIRLDRTLAPDVVRLPARFEWSTTIPRSVGLGGSSALVLATMRAALHLWQVDERPSDLSLAEAALAAETEDLGISAGLADRTVQAIGGAVLTDCRAAPMATPVAPGRDIALTLLWRSEAAAPSGEYHARLRAAVDARDPRTLRGLERLAELADHGADALRHGDTDGLARAMDASLDARRHLAPVPPAALVGVDDRRRGGAAVNFAGSGGTVVVLGPCVSATGWVVHEIQASVT